MRKRGALRSIRLSDHGDRLYGSNNITGEGFTRALHSWNGPTLTNIREFARTSSHFSATLADGRDRTADRPELKPVARTTLSDYSQLYYLNFLDSREIPNSFVHIKVNKWNDKAIMSACMFLFTKWMPKRRAQTKLTSIPCTGRERRQLKSRVHAPMLIWNGLCTSVKLAYIPLLVYVEP